MGVFKRDLFSEKLNVNLIQFEIGVVKLNNKCNK